MSKPYSDRRWWDAPKPLGSGCNFCQFHYGFGKCEKYPDGIPRDILKKSFPEPRKPDKFPKYCKFRKEKKE